jgi:hypothetical protein
MYQLLSGSAPFATFENEAPASVILRIIRDPVRPLRTAEMPIGLSDLLEAALAKNSRERPASALEFADSLVAVERASGWTPTAYLAWDEKGPIGLPAVEPVPPRPVAAAPAPLYANTPSVRAARSRLDEEPPVMPDQPADRPPTSPRAVRAGPSVAAPGAAVRQVIGPEQEGRGHDSPREPAISIPPMQPLQVPLYGRSSRSVRPVFVDPPALAEPDGPAEAGPGVRSASVFEQTFAPDVSGPPRSRADSSNVPVRRAGPPEATPLLVVGIGAAVLVLVAAVLLIVGAF